MIRLVMEIAKLPLLMSCPDCDALFSAPVVRENERVICPRCQANLFSRRPNFVHRATALVFAAAFFFILANAFPFLTTQWGRSVDELLRVSVVARVAKTLGFIEEIFGEVEGVVRVHVDACISRRAFLSCRIHSHGDEWKRSTDR